MAGSEKEVEETVKTDEEQDKVESVNTIVLECGITLTLREVRSTILLDLINRMGGFDVIKGSKKGKPVVGAAGGVDAGKATDGFLKVVNYVTGWGIVDDPPEDKAQEYEFIGTFGENPVRARWVQEIATAKEISEILGRVMAMTFGSDKD